MNRTVIEDNAPQSAELVHVTEIGLREVRLYVDEEYGLYAEVEGRETVNYSLSSVAYDAYEEVM